MKNSEKITQQITESEKEISELEQRNQKIEEDLFKIKKDHKTLVSDEGQAEIQSLTSSREIIKEVLEEKSERLEALNVDLEDAQKEETKANAVDEAAKIAKEAEQIKDEYLKLVKEIDDELYQKLVKLSQVRTEWKVLTERFIKLAQQIEPTFSVRIEESEESEENRKNFLTKVDQKAGVSSEHARSELFISFHHYQDININTGQYLPDTNFEIIRLMELAEKKHARKRQLEESEAA
ncbi:MAG: hypothetical protein WD361_14955 [Gracilimonas sp.]